MFDLVLHCHHFQRQILPRKRVVLQRYYHLSAERDHNDPINDIVSKIKQELVELWDYSSIPHQNCQGCWDIVNGGIISNVVATKMLK